MSRPSGWYQMSWDERQAWEKADRQRRDLEYEKEQAQRNLEDAHRDAARARRNYQEDVEGWRSQYYEMSERADAVAEQCDLAYEFIKQQNLWQSFQKWAKEKEKAE